MLQLTSDLTFWLDELRSSDIIIIIHNNPLLNVTKILHNYFMKSEITNGINIKQIIQEFLKWQKYNSLLPCFWPVLLGSQNKELPFYWSALSSDKIVSKNLYKTATYFKLKNLALNTETVSYPLTGDQQTSIIINTWYIWNVPSRCLVNWCTWGLGIFKSCFLQRKSTFLLFCPKEKKIKI